MRINTAVIIVASILLALPLYQAIGEEWVTVKSWSGTGSMTTEKFNIETSSFKIIWRVVDVGGFGTDNFIIDVYDSKGNTDLVVNAIVDTDGYQQETFIHSGSGTYYLDITGPQEWEILVQIPTESKTQIPSEKISLSNIQTVDAVGSRVGDISVGQQVVLQSSVKNNQLIDQKFAYIMHIKDSDGITIMIAWINGEIPSSKTFDIGLSWMPDAKGDYDVAVFVWQSVANPLPLSTKTLSVAITVA